MANPPTAVLEGIFCEAVETEHQNGPEKSGTLATTKGRRQTKESQS